MTNVTSGAAIMVALNWGKGRTGPPAPCVICTRPALCRSPKGVPCHKVCAETWITTHARDAGHRTQLIRTYTPQGSGR